MWINRMIQVALSVDGMDRLVLDFERLLLRYFVFFGA